MRWHLLVIGLCGACTVGEAGPGGPTPDAPAGGGGDAPVGGGTPNTLRITATTTTNNAPYAPRNCAVVWIEDAAGTFIKTIDRQADVRRQHLVAWVGKAGGSDTDAITGATRVNHMTPLSIAWDLKDKAGVIVPDGTYTVRMESTEANAVDASENQQGTFTFVKGAAPQTQQGLSNGGFTNVSITYTPP